MSPKSLSELELKDEVIPEQALDNLPEYGAFAPPPQPGPYKFRLPAALDAIWDVIDVTIRGQVVQRVVAFFEQADQLLIVGSPGGQYNGDLLRTRLNNAERNRGNGIEASDLDYLLRAFGEKKRPTTNRGYIDAVSAHAGQEFGADIRFSYSCNPNKPIRVYDPVSGELTPVEGHNGCEWRYYSGSGKTNAEKKIGYVSKSPVAGSEPPVQAYPLEIQCQCGAVLRAFANLENIREAK